MNLYKIVFTHYAPKGNESGIKCLLLAENDEQVYEWIASDPETSEGKIYTSWEEWGSYIYDEEKESFIDESGDEVEEAWWDKVGEPENFKKRMLRLKGEIEDDTVDFSDTYYGLTLYGWELVKESTIGDYNELIESGLVMKLK